MSVVIIKVPTQTLIVKKPGSGAVDSVNGREGVVVLDADDVGAAPTTHTHTSADISDLGNAALRDESDFELAGAVAGHTVATDPHGDRAHAAALVDDLSGVSSAPAARTNLGLTGTPHQTIRVSTRTGSTDTRTGLGVYDASKPFASVQAAIDASVSGDTIIVEPGTYTLSARLTGFSGRVLHLQDATLQGNITVSGVGDAMIRATSGQTLTITGTGTIRNTASAATVNLDAGSTPNIECDTIQNTATSGASLICGTTLALVRARQILSSLYDCVIFTRGVAHVRAERIISGTSNSIALECDTPGGQFFVDADYMTADEVFAEESSEAGTVYINCRHIEARGGPLSPLDDGGLGTYNTWYIRCDNLSGDLLSINSNVIVVDRLTRTPTDASVTLAKLADRVRVFQHTGCRRRYSISSRKGFNTLNRVGTGSGPALSGTVGVTAQSADGTFQSWTTAASINAVAGNLLLDSEANCLRSNSPRCMFRIKCPSSTTDLRLFVGIGDTQLGASDTPNCHGAYFRYSTSASDPGWVCVTNLGTSRTVSGSVRAYSASEVLLMGIDFDDTGTARFWIGTTEANLAVVHSSSSNLPTNAITLLVGVGAVIASARSIEFGHAYLFAE